MQRYTVKYRTVRSALHGTIYPRVPRYFGFAIEFALILLVFALGAVHISRLKTRRKR